MHFPLKLYQLVQAGPSEVISWSDNGKSFVIVDAILFCNKVLPKHFRHNKLTSFQRQLNLYGFQRIAKGTEAGRYYHPLFDKNRPDKLSFIKRESRSGLMSSGDGDEQALSLSDEDADLSSSSPSSFSDQVASGNRVGTRSSRPIVEKPVVAGPEDHTAALAMITISRSLSSESLSSEATHRSPTTTPSLVSNQDATLSHAASRAEFENILKQSMERQAALEAEVVQLKSLVSCMMSRMETMSTPTVVQKSLLSSANSASTCSLDSLNEDLKRQRWESEEDEGSNSDESSLGSSTKRIKESQPLPLSSPFVVNGSTPAPLSPESSEMQAGFDQ